MVPLFKLAIRKMEGDNNVYEYLKDRLRRHCESLQGILMNIRKQYCIKRGSNMEAQEEPSKNTVTYRGWNQALELLFS